MQIRRVEAEGFIGRELKASEEVRLKDKKLGLLLENLEVYDTKTKTTIDVKAEADTKELEVSK